MKNNYPTYNRRDPMEVIDNFLPYTQFSSLQNAMMDEYFSWHYNDRIVFDDEEARNDVNDFQFTHTFFAAMGIDPDPMEERMSNDLPIVMPVIDQLGCGKDDALRIKANLLTRYDTHLPNRFHVDLTDLPYDKCNTAVYYINTNDGYTEFEDGTKVESVENRMVIFDHKIKHRGTRCTDQKARIVVNFNYYV